MNEFVKLKNANLRQIFSRHKRKHQNQNEPKDGKKIIAEKHKSNMNEKESRVGVSLRSRQK
jgi:hypothetical protein